MQELCQDFIEGNYKSLDLRCKLLIYKAFAQDRVKKDLSSRIKATCSVLLWIEYGTVRYVSRFKNISSIYEGVNIFYKILFQLKLYMIMVIQVIQDDIEGY